MPHFLAVDAGGTSSRATVLTADGTCVGYGTAGGGNPVSAGPEQAATAVVSATKQALRGADLQPDQLISGVAGMAGVSVITGDDWLAGAFRSAGIPIRPVIHPDLLAIFASGSLSLDGYAMVAGTGAIAVRVRGGRIDAVADGLGWLIGDEGSGFWIGQQVVRAATAALDGRGPQTALSALVLQELGIDDDPTPDNLGRPLGLRNTVDAIYHLRPVDLARFAPLAFAAPGDRVATSIIRQAQSALATSLTAVVQPAVVGPLILGGSVLVHQPDLTTPLPQVLTDAGHPADLRPVPDGLPGAAVLALREAGVAVTAQVQAQIAASLPQARAAAGA